MTYLASLDSFHVWLVVFSVFFFFRFDAAQNKNRHGSKDVNAFGRFHLKQNGIQQVCIQKKTTMSFNV